MKKIILLLLVVLGTMSNEKVSGQNAPPWHYQITKVNHGVIIEPIVEIAGDIQIMPGDYIGVFYDSLGILACGGMIKWKNPQKNKNVVFPVWKNDATTPAKDGFNEGEPFVWKLWRKEDKSEYDLSVAYASDFPNTGYFVTDGISNVLIIVILK